MLSSSGSRRNTGERREGNRCKRIKERKRG
jgi:hypothetical protein